MTRTVNSPPDNVASTALIKTQTGITKIKEIITIACTQGWDDKQLTNALNTAIAECCKNFNDGPTREAVRKSLVNAARKWNWFLKNAIEVHNRNLIKQAKLGENFNYTVDVSALMAGKQGITVTDVRDKLTTGTNIGKPLIEDYRKKVTVALRALSAEPPVVAKYQGGQVKKIPLRNVAEMTVRYEANKQDVQRLRAQGVKLVWTTSHPNCSPRCAKYQGKLWSLDGTSGTIEGNTYRPIEPALAGPNNDGNGIISGYNCRHRLIEWKSGSKAPKEYSEAEIKKAYEIDQRQRAYENTIRQLKSEEKLMRAAGDTERAKALRKKWRKLTAEYKIYSLENDRPYHMYRCMVDESETTPLTEAVENAIINTTKTPWEKDKNGIIITKEVQNDHKGLPRESTPLNVIDKPTKKGGIQRACYDEQGRIVIEIHTDDHGNEKQHSGEHLHMTIYLGEDKYRFTLTDIPQVIKRMNKDILA